jgi:RNA polymerase sigma factor (sigma-70 family)
VSIGDEGNPPAEPPPLRLAGGRVPTTDELFDEAVRAHSRRLLSIARGILGNRAAPEDVVQQALLNLYQHRHRYDWHEAGGLMRRSVVNEALRVLRTPRMAPVADDLPAAAGGADAQPVDGLVERETVQRVRAAIDRLPEHFRSALVLCEYERLSYQEIADTLGASVPQVKTWIHRGRRQLAEMLKGYMDAQPKATRPRAPKQQATATNEATTTDEPSDAGADPELAGG